MHFVFDFNAEFCGTVEQGTVCGCFEFGKQVSHAFMCVLTADGMQTESRNTECGTAIDPGVVEFVRVDEDGSGVSGVHNDRLLSGLKFGISGFLIKDDTMILYGFGCLEDCPSCLVAAIISAVTFLKNRAAEADIIFSVKEQKTADAGRCVI